MTRAAMISALACLCIALSLGCGERDRTPRHLILISVDTLRADRLGPWGRNPEITPNLNALASESIVFERAYAPTSFTLASVGAMLTGRYPEEVGIESNFHRLSPDVPTIATMLRDAGFRTGAVVSNFALRREAGLAEGFERYDDTFPQRERNRPKPERIANHTTDAALFMLDEFYPNRESVFLWIHYQDPHGPYTPPEGIEDRFTQAEHPSMPRHLPLSRDHSGHGGIPTYQFLEGHHDPDYYRAAYDSEVAFADREIGRLLDALRQRGLLENGVVVFLADHGEGLGEDDYWFSHGDRLTDPLTRVPLMIRAPGFEPGRRSDVASLLDVGPTIAGLLGVELPSAMAAVGRNLLSTGADVVDAAVYLASLGESDLPRFGLVAGDYKLIIVGESRSSQRRLFHLGDETRDLADERPAVLESMSKRMQEIRSKLVISHRPQAQDLSAVERRMLEALGYTESQD
jgi:arylsulfatase A-like enzyme